MCVKIEDFRFLAEKIPEKLPLYRCSLELLAWRDSSLPLLFASQLLCASNAPARNTEKLTSLSKPPKACKGAVFFASLPLRELFFFVSHPPPASFWTEKNALFFFLTGDMPFGNTSEATAL